METAYLIMVDGEVEDVLVNPTKEEIELFKKANPKKELVDTRENERAYLDFIIEDEDMDDLPEDLDEY